MPTKSNIYQMSFLALTIGAFFLGAYVYSAVDLKDAILRAEGMETTTHNPDQTPAEIPSNCPNLLIQRGTELHLLNTKIPEKAGVNPVIFKTLDEYSSYVEKQKNDCPVLFLQQENNAQGEDVYRIRPSPYNPFAGLPANSAILQKYNGAVVPLADASRENGYNQNMYPGFDPYGLYVGRNTSVDVVHKSTENTKVSDNAMDPNWGGVLHTQAQVDSGKYAENEVTRPVYPTVKGAIAMKMAGLNPV